MTFKVGQSGNPGGRSTEKAVANAVRAAVNAPDPKTGRRKLELIAEMATNLAMSGEAWAVQFVADRLDGKAAQETTIKHELSIVEMTDSEIAQRVSQLRGAQAFNGDHAPAVDPSKLN